jgi:predicted small integral membrane protein
MHVRTLSRWSKILLLAAFAFFFTMIVFNNVTDFGSNYEFVRHTLSMDTTFPGNHGMWRAITNPRVYLVFYLGIIAWEVLNAVLCWWGAIKLFRARHMPDAEFQHAKIVGIAALTSALLQWLVAFECIGGEWFLMWQSHQWNGQEAGFRMFMMEAVVMLLLQMHEPNSGHNAE